MSNAYSASSDNLTPVGGADTRSLDPFGTAINESLGFLASATISNLYPIYKTIDPDYVNNISDFANIHLSKTFTGNDYVTQSDLIHLSSHYRRFFDSPSNPIDEIQSFNIEKVLKENVYQLEHLSLDFIKQLQTQLDEPVDKHVLKFNKKLQDSVDNTIDYITELNFAKGLFDYPISTDSISSFNFIKVLEDYANPIDLIAVPDGTTFTLVKTLRNTVLPSDTYKFDVSKLLESYNIIIDAPALHTFKPFADDNILFGDYNTIDFNKSTNDKVILSERTTFDVTKVLSHISEPIDFSTLSFTKSLYDLNVALSDLSSLDFNKSLNSLSITNDQLQKFDISKLLEDYTNPVDLVSIPDGSTFSLNKSLRNTVLPSDETKFYWDYVRKFNDEISNTFDNISKFDINLIKSDSVTTSEQTVRSVIKALIDKAITSDKTTISSALVKSDSINLQEQSILLVGKFISDIANGDDAISNKSFGKNLIDSLSTNDNLQYFDITKQLYDYANPVDLVSIPDGSTFNLNKTLRNTVQTNDVLTYFLQIVRFASDFVSDITDKQYLLLNKSIFETITLSETYKYSLSKAQYENITSIDHTAFDVTKPLIDISSITDSKQIIIGKPVYDLIELSEFRKLDIAKSLNEIVEQSEYRFNVVNKVLQDYANPVDLVSIPDGSTFSLNKSLRNTIQTSDSFTRFVSYVRKENEYVTFDDYINKIDVTKQLTEIVQPLELTKYTLHKLFKDLVVIEDYAIFGRSIPNDDTTAISDSSTFSFNKHLNDIIDSSSFDELLTIDFNKQLNDVTVADDILPVLSVNKSFQDYANPVDLVSIPDGSTFTLNKTLRNTVNSSDYSSLVFNKNTNETIHTTETRVFDVIKQLTDFVTILDVIDRQGSLNEQKTDSTSTLDKSTLLTVKVLKDGFNDISYLNLNNNLDFNQFNYSFDGNAGYGSIDLNTGAVVLTNIILDKTVLKPRKNLAESILITDSVISRKDSRKTINDYANPVDLVSIPDGSTFRLNKSISNAVTLSETITRKWGFKRSYSDSLSVSELKKIRFVKSRSDSIIVNELKKLNFRKKLVDNTLVSDKKYLNLRKTFNEFIYVNDLLNSQFTPGGPDVTGEEYTIIEDSGYLRMINYADITYFAEDYVGESRVFT